MPASSAQYVLLVGGEGKRMYPLTSGLPKALLPVGNRPLLSYPLASLAAAGVRSALIVATGEGTASSINTYLSHLLGSNTPEAAVHCEVVTVPDESSSADALRAVAGRISAETVVVMAADLLSDVPLQALLATHAVSEALATVLVGRRKTSPSAETKPGKAPKGVDYLGMDASERLLLFAASSPEALRDLKLPLGCVARHGRVDIRSDLQDMHLYCFSRAALQLLVAQPSISSLKLDFIPALTRHQPRTRPPRIDSLDDVTIQSDTDAEARSESRAGAVEGLGPGHERARLPGAEYVRMNHGRAGAGGNGGRQGGMVGVYVVQPGSYCARVNSVAAYGDVNREVAASDSALHLTGLTPSRHDNVLASSTTLGNKATVGPACIVGENCVLGDKASVKRSVIGNNCRLGSNAKVINCVIMDNAVIGDGCHVQNTIICSGAQVQEHCTLKDCQVGPGFVVAQHSDHKDETLAKT